MFIHHNEFNSHIWKTTTKTTRNHMKIAYDRINSKFFNYKLLHDINIRFYGEQKKKNNNRAHPFDVQFCFEDLIEKEIE